jgi:preprotein translocase subunit Sec61beta
MTPRERHDLRYIVGVAVLVIVVIAAAYLLSL